MTMKLHIRTLALMLLLLAGGVANKVWAAKVTYHVLTLPLTSTRPGNTKAAVNDLGNRLEALRIIVDNGTTVELPAHFKSPLAKNFTYYASSYITMSATAQQIYANNITKYYLYTVKGDATPTAEGTAVDANCDIYVTYEYDNTNTIAKLDGSKQYNIMMSNGFLAHNRGRNNRPAIIPEGKVSSEQLASNDFVKVDVTGTKIAKYYSYTPNIKAGNTEDAVGSQFYFWFKYLGEDPYNVTIWSTYNGDEYFVEDDGNVNKYYKNSCLFAKSKYSNKFFLSSDVDKKYKSVNTDGSNTNVEYDDMPGYFRNIGNPLWNSFAILNAIDNSGNYVYIGTKTVTDKGSFDYSTTKSDDKYQYYYLEHEDNNNLFYKLMTPENAASKFASKEPYEERTFNFKVTTPFGNTQSASIKLSEYSVNVDNKVIDVEDIPSSLKRKYCTFSGNFYKDAALTQKITKYSQVTGSDIYVAYEVSASMPFKAITPSDSYTSATWTAASWYELTDAESSQAEGKKLKYDGATNFKNNGADGEYEKTSEFAFIGDPYELRVISRSETSGAAPSYVGVASNSPSSGTAFTADDTAYSGNVWEIPDDDTAGSFLLRKYNGTGYWNWNVGQRSEDVTYGDDPTVNEVNNAQTITFNISGLTGGKYIKVTRGGTNSAQVVSTLPALDAVVDEAGTTATVTVTLSAADAAKTMTITIQEYDDEDGETPSDANPTVITINQSTTGFAGNTVEYNTSSSTRIKVMELLKCTFTYNIVDKSGRIAVKATASQTIYSPLSRASIPSIIFSPFLIDETLTFYSSYTDNAGRGSLTGVITETSNAPQNIYVKYTTTHLENKPIKLSEDQEFNVTLNGQFIYYDSDNDVIKSKANPTSEELKSANYLWKLRQRDPYAMLIDNLGARVDLGVANETETPTIYDDAGGTTTPTRQKGAWVKLASGDLGNAHGLVFSSTRAEAQQFIAKSGSAGGIYEVMLATGADIDASSTYYNIGRPSDNTVKLYDKEHFAHGNGVLDFRLEQTVTYTYHLIDKAKHKLLTLSSKNPDLYLPAEYQSPLVNTYNYYASDNITIVGDEYTPTVPGTKLSSTTDLDATFTYVASDASAYGDASNKKTATDVTDMENQAKALEATGDYYFNINNGDSYKKVSVSKAAREKVIYVTYEKNDLVKFNDSSSPYLLKFLDPLAEGYFLEDGNDRLTSSKIQAVYPYCNGDGNLNIYGQRMNDEQMNGGSSTRPRWVWFFNSDHNDPYHVKIHSKSTISYNSISHPTYLQTYAVHFNQDSPGVQHVVTGGNLSGISSISPTEYMILGTAGNYRMLTTNLIAVDTNGDGDTEDDGENERRYVTSFEQYWKTYNMLKLHVLGVNKNTNSFSNDESTWVVPTEDDPSTTPADESTYRTTIAARNWHSYDAYANATRWNGYNDKSDGKEKKVVEKIEHWFQTFDMGDGTFDIISADIPPVLVLLDRHGWEIMRKPLPPSSTYPYGDDELAVLRAYDSPMVKEYHFYSNATKASGCHKYTLRTQNGKLRDEITVNGTPYTSTSLGDLPPLTAKGLKDGGAFQDQYVTYTVKEEYENSYKYHLELHEENSTYTESGIASKFLILQNGRFARDVNDGSKPYYHSKPITESSNPVGGNVYDMILSPQTTTSAGVSTKIDDGHGKIDPINLWYVQPNLEIDDEMGIPWALEAGGSGEPKTKYETKKDYKDKTGFDPYNIQLKNVSNGKFFTMDLTSTELSNGGWEGTLGSDGGITLAAATSSGYVTPEGYDHTRLQITKQTFMAVSDDKGNMQLMPRFDHTKRVNVSTTSPWYTTLENPDNHSRTADVTVNNSMGPQTVFFVRPQVYEYHIIDNDGNEALRYKTAGEYKPFIPNHFKSPLATDFKYFYDHATNTTAASSSAAHTAAASSTAFKLSADNEDAMKTTANALEILDDFYFKVGVESPYSYKKVTVTKAHSGSDKAVYSVNNSTENEWTNAVAVQQTVANEAAMETAILSLASKGFYYYKIGPYYYYNKVVRSSGENTITASNSGEYSGSLTATDQTDFTTKAAALSSDGTYYYKIGPQYEYRKVVVTNPYNSITTEIAAGQDISAREITGTFAEADLNADENHVYVRYSYDESADIDGDNILQGNWFTMDLAGKDVQSSGTFDPSDGTGISLYAGESSRSLMATDGDDVDTKAKKLAATGDYYFKQNDEDNYWLVNVTTAYDGSTDATYTKTSGSYATEWANSKPLTPNGVDATRKWQWKFIAANKASESPDPYAVHIYNRKANYSASFVADPNPMGVGIKVNDKDRFAILSHPTGGYALAVAGLGTYSYDFLNGSSMTTSVAATTAYESGFTSKTNTISNDALLILNDDIDHNYTYNVITNNDIFAVSGTQSKAEASSNHFAPKLPENIQTPLLNLDDYDYYGGATETSGSYTMIDATKLHTVYGLYDDVVYVRYEAYNSANTHYEVPNTKTLDAGKVARDPASNDVPIDINGNLPYNIYWENDNMMKAVDSDDDGEYDDIDYDADHILSGDPEYIWQFDGNDPYALGIKHKASGKYAVGESELSGTATKTFMLLNKEGYQYGILQETGGDNKLTDYGQDLTTSDPTKFIIFGLSTHKLIYHLVINTTNVGTDIPYREGDESTYQESGTWTSSDKITIYGTTQRDLTSIDDDEAADKAAGDKYQLGETMSLNGNYVTYCYDAGQVSIGDELQVPTVFYRPNCSFDFYIGDIYNDDDCAEEHANSALINKYKGLILPKLMSDAALIDKTVVVNIVYSFNKELKTNSGLDFVKSKDDNLWYTFETYNVSTPYLAHYTNAWGLQAMEGRATRYTNDYLWTPLGDPYGFKMYNRYMIKNSGGTENVMTMPTMSEGTNLKMAVPDGSTIPYGYEVFELLAGDADGYFRVHPVVNNSGTQYFVRKDPSDDYAKLSTTPSDWTFGLDMTLIEPYYERAGYVGGLTAAGKTAYEAAENVMQLQKVVYNDDNIIHFTSGYYRLHNQPGVSDISPVRYASGYLHDIEKTAGTSSTPIPMHFYSKTGTSTTFGTSGLNNGYTVTDATRGDIPVPPTEYDPSTIFHIEKSGTLDGNPRVKISTQGLYVKGNATDDDHGDAVMTGTSGDATTFSLMDIGGAVFLIHDGTVPATRKYFHFSQSYVVGGDNKKYDLKYFHNSPTDDAKWCVEPANKQGLMVTTNNGGDDYYYTTFYAPFDVQLPADIEEDDEDPDTLYNAYKCLAWNNKMLRPKNIGKGIPAETPVIIRTTDNSGSIKLTIPSVALTPITDCVFTGSYLEKLLPVDASNDVYTFGLPFTSSVSKDGDYSTTGDISAPLPEQATSDIGFYINATPNKEADESQSLWFRNNRYVLHNKIYYRGGGGSSREDRDITRGVQFVPVVFDDGIEEEDEEDDPTAASARANEVRIYDLQGRRRTKLQKGLNIVNGKKLVIN